MKTALKNMNTREQNQLSITFNTKIVDNDTLDNGTNRTRPLDYTPEGEEGNLEIRLQRLDEFITKARRMKRKRRITNLDPM